MKDTKGMKLTMTHTACKRAAQAKLGPEAILSAFETPVDIKPSDTYPGQYKIIGDGFALVGVPMDDTRFHAITVIKEK